MNIGIDLEDNQRFKRLIQKPCFFNRVFAAEEREYIGSRGELGYRAACGIFCCKEAFCKAAGISILGLRYHECVVVHGSIGEPRLQLGQSYTGLFGQVSISHSGSYTTAVCLLKKD